MVTMLVIWRMYATLLLLRNPIKYTIDLLQSCQLNLAIKGEIDENKALKPQVPSIKKSQNFAMVIPTPSDPN